MSVLQFQSSERDLGEIGWSLGWDAVSDALVNPGAAVERYGGWEKWFRKEFLPDQGSVWKWAWAPNYGGHILAGGITYRYLWEWFDAHGTPFPAVTAGAVSWGMMVLNESLEHTTGGPGRSSTVADLYVFDPLGILVFSFDGVARFFSGTLEAADWSPMASLTFPEGRALNLGQVMSYKVGLPYQDRIRLLFLIGQSAGTGFQYRFRDQYRLGATVGFKTDNRQVDPVTGEESITPDLGGGLHLDRDNSLLASLILNKRSYMRLQVNVYPGVLPGPLGKVGVWLTRSQEGEFSLGIASRLSLGLGVGYDVGR